MELKMTVIRQYSTLFSCLHDEPGPVGELGLGAHYSIMSCATWFDDMRTPSDRGLVHKFAVVWDQDHDERVIEVIEDIYMAGHLSPVRFVGERKGNLFLVVDNYYFSNISDKERIGYIDRVSCIACARGDSWATEVACFDSEYSRNDDLKVSGIIFDHEPNVRAYLAFIDTLWGLGLRGFNPDRSGIPY